MKKEYLIVIASFIFGLLVWFFDSAVDSLFFYEDSFLNIAILKIPRPELFFRAEVLISFTIFGIMISILFSKQRKTQESLLRIQSELEERVERRTAKLSKSNKLLKTEITERVRAEKSLRHSQRMLKAVIDGISEPLVLVDEDMKVKMLNDAAVTYFGLSGDSVIIDSKCHQMLKDRAAPCEGCDVPRSISSGKSAHFERKGFMDSERLEDVYLYPVKNEDTNAWAILMRITDITEQRLLEKQIIQQEKMASLGVLTSSVAHEINNPVGFISFDIPILRDYIESLLPLVKTQFSERPDFELFNMPYDDFHEDILKLLDNIEHGSDRVTAFVSKLKEFSKTKDKMKEEWIDLSLVIERALNISRVQQLKNIQCFVTNIPENLSKIWSDAHALEQILLNLLTNAAQAVSDEKDSRVVLSVEIGNNWLEYLLLEVDDNGIGMDEKTKEKLFDPFFTSKSPKGTGLGLYVCRELVYSLGGRIAVESELGTGSKFRVILPDKERRNKKRL